MEEIVSTGVLTPDELTALIASCASFLGGATFLIEQLPSHVITQAQRKDLLRCEPFDASIRFADYTSGRIFRQDFELRWEKEGNAFRVVYVGPERNMSPLKAQGLVLEKKGSAEPYYLFGERLGTEGLEKIGSVAVEGDFADLRIPRLLHYPVEKPQRYVQLFIQEYADKETGDVVLFRFQAIIAVG